jgi:hypothetical protein
MLAYTNMICCGFISGSTSSGKRQGEGITGAEEEPPGFDSNVPRMKAAALQVRLYHGKLQQLKIIMENTVCVGEGLLELF